jgi:hypothetical protein
MHGKYKPLLYNEKTRKVYMFQTNKFSIKVTRTAELCMFSTQVEFYLFSDRVSIHNPGRPKAYSRRSGCEFTKGEQ